MPAYDVRPTHDALTLAALRELPALVKPHWPWPMKGGLLGKPDLLDETIRVLGAGSIAVDVSYYSQRANWEHEVRSVLAAMQRAGVRDLVVKTSPWGGTWLGPDYPWDDPRQAADTPRGIAEVDRIRRDLADARQFVETEANALSFPIDVAAVVINQETFILPPGAVQGTDRPPWIAALQWVNNRTGQAVRDVFPEPSIHIVQVPRGLSGYYTLSCFRTGNYSIALYDLTDVGGTRKAFRDCCDAAALAGITAVYPSLSLGGLYWRTFHASAGWKSFAFRPVYAWTIGSEINDPKFNDPALARRFAPWSAFAHRVLLWPRPFDDRCPHYGEHLVAYLCGAAGLRPDWIADA